MLYCCMVAMPATGVAMGYLSGKGLPLLGLTIPGSAHPDRDAARTLKRLHKSVGQLYELLVPLHVGAAGLHYVRGHNVFSRIDPFR